MPKVSNEDLVIREYWTPAQAARVLGRGADFWRSLFDAGTVAGYPIKGARVNRYIQAASARAYLDSLVAARPAPERNGRQRYLDAINNDPRITTSRARQKEIDEKTAGT